MHDNIDYVRGRLMARAGARFQSNLDERVFNAALKARTIGKAHKEAMTALKDLEAIQRAFITPGIMALFDLPFMPVFFFGIFIFHPWLGILAIIGTIILIGATIINQIATRTPLLDGINSFTSVRRNEYNASGKLGHNTITWNASCCVHAMVIAPE